MPEQPTETRTPEASEITDLLLLCRVALNKWATRYAGAPHAKIAVAETHKIMQQIDAIYDRFPKD